MTKKTAKNYVSNVIGHFDYIHDGYAYGWAFDKKNPLQRLTVNIVCDGVIVGHGLADQYREDLLTAGIGDGKYLFKLRISYELYDGEPHSLVAMAANSGSQLGGGAQIFGPLTSTITFDLIPREAGLELLRDMLEKDKYSAQTTNKENLEKAYSIGSQLQETYQLSDARYVWQSIIKSIGDNALCRCKIAETYLLNNELEQALNEYKISAQNDLLLYWAHIGLSNTQQMLGNVDEAESSLEFACGIVPNHKNLKDRLSKWKIDKLPEQIAKLLHKQKTDEAIELLTKSLMQAPDDKFAQEKLSSLHPDIKVHDCSSQTDNIIKSYNKSQTLLEIIINRVVSDNINNTK